MHEDLFFFCSNWVFFIIFWFESVEKINDINRHLIVEVFGFFLSLRLQWSFIQYWEKCKTFYKTNKSFVFHIYIKKDAKYTYLYDTFGISKWPINVLTRILGTHYYQCPSEFKTTVRIKSNIKSYVSRHTHKTINSCIIISVNYTHFLSSNLQFCTNKVFQLAPVYNTIVTQPIRLQVMLLSPLYENYCSLFSSKLLEHWTIPLLPLGVIVFLKNWQKWYKSQWKYKTADINNACQFNSDIAGKCT